MAPKMKWLMAVLAVSVAGNLFAAGIWLGKEFRPEDRRHGGRGPAAHIEFNMRRLAESLPEDKRVDIRRIFMANRATMREQFAQLRASEQQVRSLLLAETVDEQELKAAMEAHRERMASMRDPLMQVLTDVVAKLDQETRQQLVRDMWAPRKARFRRGGPGGLAGPDGPPPPHLRPPFEEEGAPTPDPDPEKAGEDDPARR